MKTKHDVMKMFEMRVDGKTLEEIGQQFGITRQRVQQILDNKIKCRSSGRTITKCAFPGLASYLRERYITMKAMSESLNCMSYYTFNAKMRGKNQFTMPEIKAILAYTGMTFEEAFGEEIKPVRKED